MKQGIQSTFWYMLGKWEQLLIVKGFLLGTSEEVPLLSYLIHESQSTSIVPTFLIMHSIVVNIL